MAHTQAATATPLTAARPRLRAVDPDEIAGLAGVAEFLPPGATLLPAPQHALPTLPGRPPMVGYLVLLPADSSSGSPKKVIHSGSRSPGPR
ncbi:winged helix family transcriptional regulator, partial [Streptomyces sp. NPDC006339]